MKRLLCLFTFVVFAFALAADKATVAEILKDPGKFDGKTITVTGVVKKFKAKTSRAGNKYFTFDLEEKDQKIAVYGRGELEKAPKDGDRVEASGKFTKLKDMKDFQVKNELDVSKPDAESKNGVKILKSGEQPG